MKIKLDENVPTRIKSLLANLGHDVDAVPEEGLTGQDDAVVWASAQDAQRFFVTQDMDFSDTRRFTPGTHHGILLVRLREPGREMLLEHLRNLFQTEDVAEWRGCFVVLTEHKLRIVRPR